MSDQEQCLGCGISLQGTEASQVGYIPADSLAQGKNLCQRCFRLKHYGEAITHQLPQELFLQKLSEISQKDCLVVQVVDLFDLTGSIIPGLSRHIGQNRLLIIANKADLFPETVKWQKVKAAVYAQLREVGLTPLDICFCSAQTGYKMEEAVAMLEKYRLDRDAYVIGTTNVGKSTFINWLLKKYSDADEYILASPMPGTTLDLIRIELDDHKFIVDTPGVFKQNRLIEFLEANDLKIITPRKRLKPKVYQLNAQQTLYFGGLARIDFVKGEAQPFVCYFSNELYIHRTKLETADSLLETQSGRLLSPPTDPKILPKLVKHVLQLSGKQKEDIVISGLGWVSVGQARGEIVVWVPKGVEISLRQSII